MTNAITISRTSLKITLVSLTLLLIGAPSLCAAGRPLKVFILAGRSNMDGHAKFVTFDYIGDDPATAPLLKRMRGANGKPTVCDHIWILYFKQIAESQLAVDGDKGKYPEFKGNVKALDTRDLWREADVSPVHRGYHYNHKAENYHETGDRLGRAMAELLTKSTGR